MGADENRIRDEIRTVKEDLEAHGKNDEAKKE
jgi:hypothetical protein